MYTGDLGVNDAPSATYLNGTISTKMMAARIAMNYPEHNTNLRALLTGLGLTL